MYGIICKDFLSVFFIGVTIKVMDDLIDAEADSVSGKNNGFNQLGIGVIPYIFVLFSLAVMLNKNLAVPLFLSAYMVGMVKDMNQRYLLGLPGWAESIILGAAALIFFNWLDVLTSLAALTAVQLVDDLSDRRADQVTGEKNLVSTLGLGESVIFCLILITALFIYSPYKLVLVAAAYGSITFFVEKKQGKRLFRCS